MQSFVSLQNIVIVGMVALACFNMVSATENRTTTATHSNTSTTGPSTTPDTTSASSTTTATTNVTATATTSLTTVLTTNLTTGLTNFTTETASTGTTPTVTSAPEAGWAVKERNGKLCMLMNFTGTVTQNFGQEVTADIPYYASPTKSVCNSTFSAFVLEFGHTELVLNFSKHRSSFELRTISVSQSSLSGGTSSSETTNFFTVPLGDYYSCNYFNNTVGGLFNISLVDPSLQPFVQETRTRNNFGEQYVCRPSTNFASIVIGVIIGIIILIVAIAVTCCVVKRQRRWTTSGAPYSRIQQVGV